MAQYNARTTPSSLYPLPGLTFLTRVHRHVIDCLDHQTNMTSSYTPMNRAAISCTGIPTSDASPSRDQSCKPTCAISPAHTVYLGKTSRQGAVHIMLSRTSVQEQTHRHCNPQSRNTKHTGICILLAMKPGSRAMVKRGIWHTMDRNVLSSCLVLPAPC